MSWFVVKQGRPRYRGRLSREPYVAWLKTAEGAGSLEGAARKYRFRLFATGRARRRLWRGLETAARTAPVRAAIGEEANRFGTALGQVSFAPGLPRTHVALHRLVLVPRALVAARARTGVRMRLWNLPPLAHVDESVRAFFCEQLLIELDRAIELARPSAKRPVEAGEGWSCVGSDRSYVWLDPLWAGDHWVGHVFMYEFPRSGLSRAQRRALDEAVAGLQKSIALLSRVQRDGLMRTAADGLTPASSRALAAS
jgi:hypothetical protein